METFTITFGADQKDFIDPVLNQLVKEKLVKEYSSTKIGKFLKYKIEFVHSYGIYRLGHDQVIYVQQKI